MKFKKVTQIILKILVMSWIILCLYSLGIIEYAQGSTYQKYFSAIFPKGHSINMAYYRFIYPLIYQDYIWTK